MGWPLVSEWLTASLDPSASVSLDPSASVGLVYGWLDCDDSFIVQPAEQHVLCYVPRSSDAGGGLSNHIKELL